LEFCSPSKFGGDWWLAYSPQLYRGLMSALRSLGGERQGVTHHLIDVLGSRGSGDWVDYREREPFRLEDLRARKRCRFSPLVRSLPASLLKDSPTCRFGRKSCANGVCQRCPLIRRVICIAILTRWIQSHEKIARATSSNDLAVKFACWLRSAVGSPSRRQEIRCAACGHKNWAVAEREASIYEFTLDTDADARLRLDGRGTGLCASGPAGRRQAFDSSATANFSPCSTAK